MVHGPGRNMSAKLLTVECIRKDAIISECGKYRYRLTRVWDKALPIMGWVMLNPSTADASEDDPTIRKCCHYAKRDGFGGIEVVNMFAWRATDPRELKRVSDPYGRENTDYIESMDVNQRVVVAWGGKPVLVKAIDALHNLDCYCLGVNQDGSPRHPLYLPADCPLTPWSLSDFAGAIL